MKTFSINRWMWWFWIYLIRISCFYFQLSPFTLPRNEKRKIHDAAILSDVLIIFNPGGWGDATLERASDFSPILEGIQQTISGLGYCSTVVPYTRTLSSLYGRIAGIKEQLNSFKNSSRIQAEDIKYLVDLFPKKRVILAGFSTGGGLTGKTMEKIACLPQVYGIMVGVPGWFSTYSSDSSLVLNNTNRDPIAAGYVNIIALTVFKAPLKWLRAKITGRDLSLPLALEFPYHEYSWSSSEVGVPIIKFLEANLTVNPNRHLILKTK